MGATKDIQLERFVEALEDPNTGLTYPALTGIRKQSVDDVERLFGAGVVKFMEEKGYRQEAKYLSIVHNWRRAIDERGLSTQQRQQFREDFLTFLLNDWMPWHAQQDHKDFSLLEVNRLVACVYSVFLVLRIMIIVTWCVCLYTTIKF